jgi:hypothetical protein
MGGALALTVAGLGAWPAAVPAASSIQLSASRAETHAAALDALVGIDPYVDPSRIDAVRSEFVSVYGSLADDARTVVDSVLDALSGPDQVPLAARGNGRQRVAFLRRAVRGFDGDPASAIASARLQAALAFVTNPFYPPESPRRPGPAGYLLAMEKTGWPR